MAAPAIQARAIAQEILLANIGPGERLARMALRLYLLGISEVPRASNDGPWIRYFLRGDRGLAWCAAFLLRMMLLLGCPMPSIGYWRARSVNAWRKCSIADGTWMGAAIEPRRGDIMVWGARHGSDAGAGKHVDVIVETKTVGDELRLTVVGGNVGNRVAQRVIAHRDPRIIGYIRLAEPMR